MDMLKEKQAQRAKAQADLDALLYEPDGETRELSDEDRAAADGLIPRITAMDEEIEVMQADEARYKSAQASRAKLNALSARQVTPAQPSAMAPLAERTIPATARRYGHLRHFTGPGGELEAYRFGTWFAGTQGVPWAVQRCREQGIVLARAQTEGTNTAGGFAVPDEFENRFIYLREEYGVFRKFANVEPMSTETKSIMRQTGGLTAYPVGEITALTESNITLDQVNLTAKKFGCVTIFSSELNEDAVIGMADKLAGDMAHAFALKEDQCGFIGTGAATYAGIVGIAQQLNTVNGVDEGGGIIVANGNLPSEFLIGDWGKVPGLVPAYVDPQRCRWYMHKSVWSSGWLRLEIALAGNTWPMVNAGEQAPRILGYPVEFVQAMPYCAAGTEMSVTLALFGDLSLAATMGDRRGMTIGVGTEGTVGSVNLFEQDASAIRATERFDINVHDVGTATVAGPVVALIGKAS